MMNGFEYTENARAGEGKAGRVKIVSFETRAATLLVSYNYDPMQTALYAAELENQIAALKERIAEAIGDEKRDAETIEKLRDENARLWGDKYERSLVYEQQRAKIGQLEAERDELRDWKERAMRAMENIKNG